MAKLQLYSLATPNGQKVSIALEEMGLAYDAHTINILNGDQFTDEFIAINPNSKIPALVDPDTPAGELKIFESGNILQYLGEKSGQFYPRDLKRRNEVNNWLFFQMGGVGPMFGQFGHFFKYAKDKCNHDYPVTRYTNEAKRLLNVINTRLETSEFIATNEYTIADMAIYPWVLCLDKFYGASDILELPNFIQMQRWMKEISKREATKKGLDICGF
tara:strand:+ start:175047 stop:175694 length:648 start_codon:yes stop_codon:yes gene_type:complete